MNINPSSLFNELLVFNKFVIFGKICIVAASLVVLLLYSGLLGREETINNFEYPILLLFATLSMMLLVCANDFFILYMFIEMQAFCLYIAAAINRDKIKSSEAGLKYFILGSLASGVLLYGISLVYGYLGTTNFTQIDQIILASPNVNELPVAAIIGIVMILNYAPSRISWPRGWQRGEYP